MDFKLNSTQEKLIAELNQTTDFLIKIGRNEFYEFIIQQYGIVYWHYKNLDHTGGAFTANKENDIKCLFWIPEYKPQYATKVLFHELGHAAGYPLNHRTATTYTQKEYQIEEVIAEYVALDLMAHFDWDSADIQEYSGKYICKFSKGLTVEEIHECRSFASERVNYILKQWFPDFAFEFALNHKAAV